METGFVQFQIETSTGEEELNLFGGGAGQFAITSEIDSNSIMPPGIYRVMNGEIYRIIGGSAPINER
jgi:hypothetical protein